MLLVPTSPSPSPSPPPPPPPPLPATALFPFAPLFDLAAAFGVESPQCHDFCTDNNIGILPSVLVNCCCGCCGGGGSGIADGLFNGHCSYSFGE